jgi:hypothetical protein
MWVSAHGPLGRGTGRLGYAGHVHRRRPAGPSWEFSPKSLRKLENHFSFLKLFYKLQTNLNFNDLYSYNKIQEHFITPRKICNGMNATNNYLFKYISL